MVTLFFCPLQNFCPINIVITKSELNLMNEIRMLWEQHGAWTRMTIVSLVLDSPDVEFVTKRLLRNPKDFQMTLKPFYGDKIASKFSDLLTSHLTLAAQLVKAAKAGNTKLAADIEKQWYANADEIAAFLASINPYWSERNWRIMLYKHLKFVKDEAVCMLIKDYAASIDVYDKMEMQILEMADMMANGIIRQLPCEFIK